MFPRLALCARLQTRSWGSTVRGFSQTKCKSTMMQEPDSLLILCLSLHHLLWIKGQRRNPVCACFWCWFFWSFCVFTFKYSPSHPVPWEGLGPPEWVQAGQAHRSEAGQRCGDTWWWGRSGVRKAGLHRGTGNEYINVNADTEWGGHCF